MTNEQLTEFQNIAYSNRHNLVKMADAILRSAGLDSSGRPKGAVSSEQQKFEAKMQLGAYSTNGARR